MEEVTLESTLGELHHLQEAREEQNLDTRVSMCKDTGAREALDFW